MAKKKNVKKPPRELTRHQLAKWQQQQRRQRFIFSIGILVIAAVVLIIGVGWYVGGYRPLHQTAIRVNETEFDMDYYIEMLRLSGEGQPPEYMAYIADSVTREIEQSELIRQGALKLGIEVSDKEITEHFKTISLKLTDATGDLVGSQLLLGKLGDEYFDSRVPVSAEQVHIMAMLLESESQAIEVRNRIEGGEDFAELAGEYSLNLLTKNDKGDIGWHTDGILTEMLGSSVPAEFAFSSEAGALSQPLYDQETTKEVGYWLIEVLVRGEAGDEEADVQAMLLGSRQEAEDITARLGATDNFTALAKEYSQVDGADENEGVLGTVIKGEYTAAFDEFVFNLDIEPGTMSEPIRDDTVYTKGGYWLVKVLDKDDNRQIEEEDRDSLKSKELNKWVLSLWDDPDNVVDDGYLDAERKAWAIEQAAGG